MNIGYNLRPTEVQAVIGMKQLPKLKGFIKNRRKAWTKYRAGLDKYSKYFRFQQEQKNGEASWFGFCITLTDDCPFYLREITKFLHSKGVETRPIIAGNMARHPALKMYEHRVSGELRNCDKIMKQGFAIGCHQAIDAKAQKYVIKCFDEFMNGRLS